MTTPVSLPTSLRAFAACLREFADRRVLLILLLLVVVTLAEGGNLLALLPLLQVVGVEASAPASGLSGWIVTHLRAWGIPPTLPALLGLFLGLAAVQVVARAWLAVQNSRLQSGFTLFLRRRFYAALTRAKWSAFLRRRPSDIVQALTAEMQIAGTGVNQSVQILAATATAAIQTAIAFAVSPSVTLLALLAGGVIILVRGGPRRSAHAHATTGQERRGAMAAAVTEHLSGIKVAKSHGREAAHAAIFGQIAGEVADRQVRVARAQAFSRALFDLAAAAALCGFALYAVEVARMKGAELLLLGFIFLRTITRLSAIQTAWQQIVQMLPSFAAAEKLRAHLVASAEPSAGEDSPPVALEREIRLDSVRFRYEGSNTPALDGIDLVIPASKILAISGPSGAGKSTLADMLLGLLPPDSGHVLLDGIPLVGEHAHRWRRSVGYVPQETFLFHDTLRANLLWSRPDATDEELRTALRAAAAEEFVSRLPDGLDTVVGDRGTRFSGGERQRIALARALLRQPALLLLDEATTSLDPQNERLIYEALDRMRGTLTIVLITHRHSVLQIADHTILLNEGHVQLRQSSGSSRGDFSH